MSKVKPKSSPKSPSLLQVGKTVFVRTVTNFFTGTITEIAEHEVSFSDASWIADTGRFHQFLKDGKLNEVEPIPDGLLTIGRGAIVDVSTWNHILPRTQL